MHSMRQKNIYANPVIYNCQQRVDQNLYMTLLTQSLLLIDNISLDAHKITMQEEKKPTVDHTIS